MNMLETLLTSTIQTFVGLLAQAGFGNDIRELKTHLTGSTDTKRRRAFERAFAQARRAVGEDVLAPLLDHRPFQEGVVKALLDPANGFDMQAVAGVWQETVPSQARAFRRFFTTLENALLADDVWGPILERLEQQRARPEIRRALGEAQLDLPTEEIVRRVSAQVSGSGALALSGGIAAGERGVAVGGNVGQIVLQQILVQSGMPNAPHDARERYLTQLHNRCCALPLDALGGEAESHKTVTLDQVYIALNTTLLVSPHLLEQIEHGIAVDWADLRGELSGESAGRKPAKRGSALRPEDDEEQRLALPARDALRLTRRLVLLGDPGAGKSSFVRIVVAQLAREAPPPGIAAKLLPVLVVLRDVVPRLCSIDFAALPGDKHTSALADAVRSQILADLTELDAAGFSDALQSALATGQCLLVFDGFDEVPSDERGLVRKAVVATLERYQPAHVIVTCRTRSYVYDAVLTDFEVVTLAPFDASQIETFAEVWYAAQKDLGRVDATHAKAKSADLAKAALSPELTELSANPMLLTAMALIHQKEVGLPRERVRLYSKAVEVLLYRWQQEKISQAALAAFLRDDRRLRTVMERLAYQAHHAKSDRQTEGADISRYQAQDVIEDYLNDAQHARAFLNYVDHRAGLLVGRGGDPNRPAEYSFPHRTFQEYLAGCYLLTGSDSDRVAEFYARAAEGDRWSLVAQLGAEELLYNTRNGEQQLLYLAYNLLGDHVASEQDQRAALWAAQMTDLVERRQIERDTRSPNGGSAYLQRLAQQLVRLVAGGLPAPERVQAGDVLARLGDPRFRTDAWSLPDKDLLGFVEIKTGAFLMGSNTSDQDAEDNEKPQHTLTLPTYYIGRYPVTVGQFGAFVEASGYKPQDEDYRQQGPLNHPIVYVTWHDALAYCEWLTKVLREWEGTPEPLATLLRDKDWQATLPSEAEWEKAARGADGRIYPWGNAFDPNKANVGDTGIGRTSAVGSFPSGASPYEMLDMSGNVWEWTRSVWGTDYSKPDFLYPYQPKDGREDLHTSDEVYRVLRGGGFFFVQWRARCAFRLWYAPVDGISFGGFRVVVLPNSDL